MSINFYSSVVFATMSALTNNPHLVSPLFSLETHKYHSRCVMSYEYVNWVGTIYTWNFGRSSNMMTKTMASKQLLMHPNAIVAASYPTWATHTTRQLRRSKNRISMAGMQSKAECCKSTTILPDCFSQFDTHVHTKQRIEHFSIFQSQQSMEGSRQDTLHIWHFPRKPGAPKVI